MKNAAFGVTWLLPKHASEVVGLFAFPHGVDQSDDLFWRTHDDGSVQVGVLCSDFFMYACADVEMIEAEDMPLLRRTLADLEAIDETLWLAQLFAARKRHAAPVASWGQGEATAEALRDLFAEAPSYELPAATSPADQTVPEPPGGRPDRSVHELEDACRVLWAELGVSETNLIAAEFPDLANFLGDLHRSIEHDPNGIRPNVWVAGENTEQ